jgi:Cu/Ag efflux pump CusA
MAEESSSEVVPNRVQPPARGASPALYGILTAALRFRLLLVAGATVLLVLGGLTLRRMPTDPVGALGSGPVLEVQTEALGLSSQEVEQYVTVPMENNLLDGVMGVWDVRSQSLPGVSVVDLMFGPGVTTLHARQLVEERLTNAFSLPNVSQPPLLIQPLASSSRAVMIGLSSRSVDPLELSYLARWVVKPRLTGVSGVANVVIFGQRDRQLQVLVDPARLAAKHVTLSQVIQTAGNAQLVSPLTYLEGAAPGTGGFLDGSNQRLEVRPVLPLGAPRDLAGVPVAGASGKLPLGRVARVVLSNQPLIGDAITRQGPGLILLVQRLPGSSVRGVTNGVRRALGDLAPALRGVQVDTGLYTPARYAGAALSNVGLAALIAAVLVLVALLATLLDLGAAAIAALAVAVSLVAAALVLDLLGYELSATAILGLLLGATLIVDDAVGSVLALRDRATGRLSPAVARAALGTPRTALGYATVIVLLTLVPAFIAHGLAATFVHPMLLAIGLAALTGLVVAVTLTPALAMLLLGRLPHRRPGAGTRAGERYAAQVSRLAGLPRVIPLALCLAGVAAMASLAFLHEPGAPPFRDRDLVVDFAGPAGTSLTEMDRVSGRTLSTVRALPGVSGASATLGRAVAGDRLVDDSSAQLYVRVAGGADLPQVTRAVRAVVGSVPGFTATVGNAETESLAGVLTPAHPSLTVRVYGEDPATLARLARGVAAYLTSVPGLGRPRIAVQAQEPNIEVRVNDAAALRAGVLPGDARRQASTLVSGLTVGNFFEQQAVFDVVVRGTPDVRSSLDAVRNLQIDTSSGGHVPLSRIATVAIHRDPVAIRHEALSRYADVVVPRTDISAGTAAAAGRQAIATQHPPIGYHAEVLGGTPEDATSRGTFFTYVLAAAIGILLLLQAALRSWRLAATVFFTLPVALLGGLVVMLAAGWGRSLGADAGLLAVFGLAVRHGTVLTSEIRRRQQLDGARLDAGHVAAAARTRLAPVLVSTVVLAAALIPFLVLGDRPGGELPHVAAGVVLGGLASMVLYVLILLPAACSAFAAAEAPPDVEDLHELEPDRDLVLTP